MPAASPDIFISLALGALTRQKMIGLSCDAAQPIYAPDPDLMLAHTSLAMLEEALPSVEGRYLPAAYARSAKVLEVELWRHTVVPQRPVITSEPSSAQLAAPWTFLYLHDQFKQELSAGLGGASYFSFAALSPTHPSYASALRQQALPGCYLAQLWQA